VVRHALINRAEGRAVREQAAGFHHHRPEADRGDAGGTLVAAVYSWDTALKVLTINPSSSLSGSSDYLITLSGVTDIYGQVFANTIRNFTTA
jgi:hypothetical protein